MSHVTGVPLEHFEEPIRVALTYYAERSEGRVAFDVDAAARLECTPNKPNAARSATTVRHLGESAGQLFVIAFAPGDGTGDESARTLASLNTNVYPRTPRVVPRDKSAVHSEAHLTLASFHADAPQTEPQLFAGNQQLLGLDGTTVVKLSELGQDAAHFQAIMAGERSGPPIATYTTGFDHDKRFGDPHAVYNAHPEFVQVCGFIALSPENAPAHLPIFHDLEVGRPS
jgi:hypothetical protein